MIRCAGAASIWVVYHRQTGVLRWCKPREFEHFCRKLLQAYGFRDETVANRGRDGGIEAIELSLTERSECMTVSAKLLLLLAK
jgi:hypothetical protein